MVSGTISDNLTPKRPYFTSLFGQTPFRNSVAMAAPKVPGDQKLLERRVFYVLTMSATEAPLWFVKLKFGAKILPVYRPLNIKVK